MKGFCSFWLCFSSGEASVDASHGRGAVKEAGLANSNPQLSGEGVAKHGSPVSREDRDSASFQRDKPAPKEGGTDPSLAGGDGDSAYSAAPQHGLASGLPHNERALRALLQKAKASVAQHSRALQHPGAGSSATGGSDEADCIKKLLADAELKQSSSQIVEACSIPRPDTRTLLRVKALLGELRSWLSARPSLAAATALLYVAGEGLAHAEHCVRSVGQVRFWQPDAVSAFLALLQVYGDLLGQASLVAKRQKRQPLRSVAQTQQGSRAQTASGSGADESDRQQQGELAEQQHPLAAAVASLLLRPDWLDLLSEALELLHFNKEYAAAASRAGRPPQEDLSAALQLWAFLTQLAKFAASQADNVQRMSACLQRLAALLAPPSGAVPRLLALPLREDTLPAQLHAFWLLQVLYDMPDAKVLYQPGVADHYVALHQEAMAENYEASAADPHSAAAELCRIHATLLRSLARQPGQPVRAAFARARTAEWLLQELSLESQLLPSVQQAEEAGEDGADTDSEVASSVEEGERDSDDEAQGADRSCKANSSRGAEPAAANAGPAAPAEVSCADDGVKGGDAQGGRGFAFTYDLNEDVERLMALEDKLGRTLEVDGFEYDEEGRQLMARSDARQAEAAVAAQAAFSAAVTAAAQAAAAAAAAAANGEQGGEQHRARVSVRTSRGSDGTAEAVLAAQDEAASLLHTGSGATTDNGGLWGSGGTMNGATVSRRSSNVPRLTLAGLRTCSISSLAVKSMRSSSTGRRPLGNMASRISGVNSNWGAGTSAGGEADDDTTGETDEALPEEELMTPVADPAVAAERVAHWSSTLVESSHHGPDDSSTEARDALGGSSLAASRGLALRSRGLSGVSVASGVSARSLQIADPALQEDSGPSTAPSPTAPSPMSFYARELTNGSNVHAGPQGELHMMVPSSAASVARGLTHGSPGGPGLGRPPLAPRPVVPPLRMGTGTSLTDGVTGSPSTRPPSLPASARAGPPPLPSSRAMVLLSASNRANGGVWASASGNAVSDQQQQQQPQQQLAGAAPASETVELQSGGLADEPSLLLRDTPQLLPAPAEQPAEVFSVLATSASDPAATQPRPRQPVIPVLNLTSVRRAGTGVSARGPSTDTGRTLALSAMFRGSRNANGSGGSLPGGSAMDSCATPPTALAGRMTATSIASASSAAGLSPPDVPASSSWRHVSASASHGHGDCAGAPLQRIPEAGQPSETGQLTDAGHPLDAGLPSEAGQLFPDASYEEQACRRLLYQDPTTHQLMLKILLDLLVAPAGGLDPAYVPQRPADSGAPHAEYTLLWHLNAPRNGAVVQELCRRAQRRAALAAAATGLATGRPSAVTAGARASEVPQEQGGRRTATGSGSAPDDSAREREVALPARPARSARVRSGADAVVPLARPGAVARVLQLLSRPLFDASRYSNLQFVARGAYGGIYRARMEQQRSTPPTPQLQPDRSSVSPAASAAAAAQAAAVSGALQVVIKTIPLPSSPYDGCVLADVFGEVAIMERFAGHECICQLLDYGMHDDAYWIVMRRYRCSLAEWRARQRPLGDAAAAPQAVTRSVRAAACVYLSALAQVVEALQLLASHNVVHFDLKCSNVLIEPLPGVRDGELWAPVGGSTSGAESGGSGGDTGSSSSGGASSGGASSGGGSSGGASSVVSSGGASCGGGVSSDITNTSGGGSSNAGSSGGASTGVASSGGASSSSSTRTHVVPFRCVLADFGEARAYRCAAEAFTARNRGTEVFKSPEMLMLDAGGRASAGAIPSAAGTTPERPRSAQASAPGPRPPSASVNVPAPVPSPLSPDHKLPPGAPLGRPASRPSSAEPAKPRQALAGAGLASDVWSLGCLAYELLSGTVLFAGDYASVTHRVAFGTGDHLALTEAEQARLGRLPQLVGLVEWILARDPTKRPSLEQIQARIQHARAELCAC